MKLTKTEKSWVMYDWANSSFATIMLVVFPIYFASICAAQGQSGDLWWGIGTSISTATVAVLAPIIGTIADFKGMRKKLFSMFLVIGLAFTLFNAFTGIWQLMLVGYVISHIGFSGSCVVYDGFLPDITTKDKMDKVSSYGFAFGYLGGSTIPFLMSIALITFGENFGIDSVLAIKISVVITVLWWGLFSIPFLRNVHQVNGVSHPEGNVVKEVFLSIWRMIKKISKNKVMLFFMIAYFFYIDGVNTVINMASSYGATLGLDSTKMIFALLTTQIVAFPFALLFGKLSRKFGSIKMIKTAIVMYLFICIMGFIMGFGLEESFLNFEQATVIFWAMAVLVGTVQGGIQAISRSHFAKLVPPKNSGEYFGFFDIFGKFAAVIGPVLYSLVKAITGRSSISILSVIVLFLAGLIVLVIGEKFNKEPSNLTL